MREVVICEPLRTPVARPAEWGMSPDDRLNPHGSGISMGHLVGATGGRIFATMLRELDRRGGDVAVETMCIGGGQRPAAVFRRRGR
jgi:acetyl-CoA C-acetyltransferase